MKPVVLHVLRNRRLFWRMIPVVIFGLLYVAFAVWRVRLHFEVKGKIALIQTAGFPTSGGELNEWLFPVEPHENGALVLTQAFALLDSPQVFLSEGARPRLIATNTWSPEIRTGVHGYLATNASALAEIDRALAFRRFRFPIDWTEGFVAKLPHLRSSKKSAVALALRTALAAEEGREWSNFLENQIRFGETLNEEPTVIGFLVGRALLQIAINTAERSLLHSRPDTAACQRLSTAFLHAAETNLLARAFIGERAIAVPIFRAVPHYSELSKADDESEPVSPKGRPRRYKLSFRMVGIFDRDLNFYLDSMDLAIQLARNPTPAKLALTNQFTAVDTKTESRYYIFSSMLLPALRKVAVRDAAIEAGLRMAAAALAIEAFRQTHGKLPGNLEQLTPAFLKEVPLDPFTSQPLRYSVRPTGYRVYSVGPDGVDDGGRPEPKRRRGLSPSNYDLTFTVPKEVRL